MTKRKIKRQPWGRKLEESTSTSTPTLPWPPQWKPVEQSHQFKMGMIAHYLKPWDLEKVEGDGIDTLKRFLKQVRESRGYDIDCVPQQCFTRCPFWPIPTKHWKTDGFERSFLMKRVEFAVGEINAQAQRHGEKYELKDVVKLVEAMVYFFGFLTFNVMEVAPDAGVVKTVQALVWTIPGRNFELVEWRFKPGPPDAAPETPDDTSSDFDVSTHDVTSWGDSDSDGEMGW